MMLVRSERQLEAIGEQCARRLLRQWSLPRASSRVLALAGELGAGKTTFLRGFARGLGIRRRMTSPTFILARRYRIPRRGSPAADRIQPRASLFWHLDVYRLRGPKDLASIEYGELVRDPHNIVAIEWADKIRKAVPKHALWIQFRHHAKGRIITFTKPKTYRAKNRRKTKHGNAKIQNPNVKSNPNAQNPKCDY